MDATISDAVHVLVIFLPYYPSCYTEDADDELRKLKDRAESHGALNHSPCFVQGKTLKSAERAARGNVSALRGTEVLHASCQ